MAATLYSLRLSHPSHAVRLMLERKGIEHRVRSLPAGFHPLILHAAGFRGGTVPALSIDGRRVQRSREIAAALDQIHPEPPLFPAEEDRRRAVRAAEEWGERTLQPLPRRFIRWGVKRSLELRRWLAGEVERMPAPNLVARAAIVNAAYFARVSHADDATVRADLQRLPALLDEVARLIDAGTIGGAEPNAADFQIGTTTRALVAFDDLRDAVEPTPAGQLGLRILPDYPYRVRRFLPQDWIAHL